MRHFETVHAEPKEFIKFPTYRVNFWQKPIAGGGWPLDAYVILGAGSVTEVISWVEKNARGRDFEIFAEMDEEPVGSFDMPRKSGLVRLLGKNPNEEDGITIEIGKFTKV